MGSVNLDNTGSGSAITLSSDGTDLLLDGTAIGGGGGGSPDLFDESYDGTSTKPSASGTNSFAIGQEATTSAYGSLALGWRATASGTRSVALGYSLASGANSIGIAVDNNGIGATGSNSVAITRDTRASATNAIAFGQYNNVSHNNSAAFGYDVQSTAINQVSIGGTTQDVRISETYTLPKVDGSANEVLTTDGSGAVSWAAAGGGSMNLISTQNISSAVSSIDFTSLGSYTRWKIIGSYKWSSGAIAALKLFDNGSLISGSQYSSYRTKDYDTPAIFNGSYGFLANNIGIQNASFIWDIIMVDGRPYVKMDTSGQTSSSHASQEQCNTSGMLVDSYSLTSLTGFSVTATGGTCNTGQISLYGIST